MRVELNQNRLCLERKKVMKVAGGIGHTVVCHSGIVWVTQDGDARDILLRAGETFTFDSEGPALLQAFEPGAISIVQAKRQARTKGLSEFLRALLSSNRPARGAFGA
jgi:hypothetical protein